MPALTRQSYLLVEVETAAGTAAAPTANPDAMVVYDLNFQPIAESTSTERKPLTGALGATELAVAGAFAGSVSCKTYLSGSSAAGTAPPWSLLWIASGAQQDVTVTPSVVFTPATGYAFPGSYATNADYAGMATVTMWCHQGSTAGSSNAINWKLYGCMGDWTMDAEMGKPITMSWEFKGVYTAPADDATFTAATLVAHQTPPAFMGASCTWTPASGGGSHTAVVRKLQVKGGNNVILRPDANSAAGYKSALITDRSPTYSIEIEVPDDFDHTAGQDWYGILSGATAGKWEFGPLGSGAGATMQFDMDKCGISKITQSDADGIQILQLEGYCATSTLATGGDEWDLTIT